MKLIKEITEKDLGLSSTGKLEENNYKFREAARAVVFNKDNKIVLISSPGQKIHKIPGGGVDVGENIEQALRREVKEESGCQIEIKDEIGMIKEYRNKYKQLNISYCYIARVVGKIEPPKFTDKEKRCGFKIDWVTLDEAIELFKKDKPEDYFALFMSTRDKFLLKEVKKLVKK